jgi:hypothetical protein
VNATWPDLLTRQTPDEDEDRGEEEAMNDSEDGADEDDDGGGLICAHICAVHLTVVLGDDYVDYDSDEGFHESVEKTDIDPYAGIATITTLKC